MSFWRTHLRAAYRYRTVYLAALQSSARLFVAPGNGIAGDNALSLGYLTIVGAYILPGSRHDTATLVDLAVVDPATRSLVLRAGGTSTSHGSATLVDVDRSSRKASASGFNDATNQMIGNFDTALTAFQADVHNGNANVRVIARNASSGTGGGGSVDTIDVIALLILSGTAAAWRSRFVNGRRN